jgi:hypothetical protein
MPRFLRGAKPTPRYLLAAAMPHTVIGDTPPQLLWLPKELNMWGNATYGDCCTAEEAFAKACNQPEIYIPPKIVIAWARKNKVLNGSTLQRVLHVMQGGGFPGDSVTYDDGPPKAVNWRAPKVLRNAISLGPVKLGVAADQLETVPNIGLKNGWIATGFTEDQNLDHCTSLCGYGPAEWLMTQLGGTLPEDIEPSTLFYALFTWSTIGLIAVDSMLAITGEAWLRNPTTVTKPNPA